MRPLGSKFAPHRSRFRCRPLHDLTAFPVSDVASGRMDPNQNCLCIQGMMGITFPAKALQCLRNVPIYSQDAVSYSGSEKPQGFLEPMAPPAVVPRI